MTFIKKHLFVEVALVFCLCVFIISNFMCKSDKFCVSNDIAKMAVSWSYPQGESGLPWYDIDNSDAELSACTSLYVATKDAVLDEVDPYYSSSDRGVATAVRAAGADDDFPLGNSSGQLIYAQEHPDKWQALGSIKTISDLDNLQPGDLLLSNGHSMVFVGSDLPLKKWSDGAGELTDCKYSVVHSSRSISDTQASRGPRCDNDCRWILSDSSMWYAFRAVNIDESSEKRAAAESVFLSDFTDGSGVVGATYTPRD